MKKLLLLFTVQVCLKAQYETQCRNLESTKKVRMPPKYSIMSSIYTKALIIAWYLFLFWICTNREVSKNICGNNFFWAWPLQQEPVRLYLVCYGRLCLQQDPRIWTNLTNAFIFYLMIQIRDEFTSPNLTILYGKCSLN